MAKDYKENRLKRIARVKHEKRSKAIALAKKRLERKKLEKKNPELKKKRQAENVPKTADNMRQWDPSMMTKPANMHPDWKMPVPSKAAAPSHEAGPSNSNTDVSTIRDNEMDTENQQDIANDPFSAYFDTDAERDPTIPPRILITTSPAASPPTFEFCDEIVGVFPGAEFFKRRKRTWHANTPAIGTIAQWAIKRGYSSLMVVNEDHHRPNGLTIVHLPNGPTAYFKLSSIALTKQISGHARPSPHYPELILNGFVTRLGHAVGRMFQTLFPPMPEFEGRQVVTLHNQRDYMFFRRHRYMFKSIERTALQEMGPRFTLKLRSMKTGLPVVNHLGFPGKPLQLADVEENEQTDKKQEVQASEFAWSWNPRLELNKKMFFL